MDCLAKASTIHGVSDYVDAAKKGTKARYVWLAVICICGGVLLWYTVVAALYFHECPNATLLTVVPNASLPAVYFCPGLIIGHGKKLVEYGLHSVDSVAYLNGFLPESADFMRTLRGLSGTFNATTERTKLWRVLDLYNMSLRCLVEDIASSVLNGSHLTFINNEACYGINVKGNEIHKRGNELISHGFLQLNGFAESLPPPLDKLFEFGALWFGSPEVPLDQFCQGRGRATFKYGYTTSFSFESLTVKSDKTANCITNEETAAAAKKERRCIETAFLESGLTRLPLSRSRRKLLRTKAVFCNYFDPTPTGLALHNSARVAARLAQDCDDLRSKRDARLCDLTLYGYSAKWNSGRWLRVSSSGDPVVENITTLLFTSYYGKSLVIEEKPLCSWQKFLSDIGGLLSLLFGASLINVAQLLHGIIEAAAHCCPRKRKKKKPKTSASSKFLPSSEIAETCTD